MYRRVLYFGDRQILAMKLNGGWRRNQDREVWYTRLAFASKGEVV